MKINVLTKWFDSPNETAFLYPLLRHKSGLKEEGFIIDYFSEISSKLLDCDVILISSKFFSKKWESHQIQETLETIDKLKKRNAKLIYADISDSSGTVHLKMLGIIDLYIKNQVYKNKLNYMKSFYGYRIYTDYYNKEFKIKDRFPSYSEPAINSKDLNKIQIGWNSSLGNYGNLSFYFQKLINNFGLKLTLPYPKPNFVPINRRTIDLHARFNLKYKRNTISFQRTLLKEKLEAFLLTNKKINRYLYYKEMLNSKIILSPFGLGEITLKDFEVFLTGGFLIKPNLNHLETWPNLFVENKFFKSHKWDLSDLNEIIDFCLSNINIISELAYNGQKNYLSYIQGESAKINFVNQFKLIINKLK